CAAAGREDLAGDARFATNSSRVKNRATLVPLLEELLRTRTTQAWEEVLLAAEVPHAPVWDYAQVVAHPHAAARHLRVTVRDRHGRPVDLVGTPFHITGTDLPQPAAPPALGQDTDGVLGELLGLDAARLAELRRQGVI